MSNYHKQSNKSLYIVIGSLVFILTILFGLNSLLTRQNKKDISAINTPAKPFYLKGSETAKVRIVEYADFQCPACKYYSPILNKVFDDINNKYGSSSVSIVYKYFPLLTIHKNAMISAQSAEAAGLQGKFWEMHDILFEKQNEWGEALDAKEKIESYAISLGIDIDKFRIDRDSKETKDRITDSLKEGNRIELNHTPTIYLDGKELVEIGGYEGLSNSILTALGVSTTSSATTTQN